MTFKGERDHQNPRDETGVDGPDQHIDDDLFNDDYGTGGEDELTPEQARAALLKKIVAGLTVLIFSFIVLANLLRLFTLPPLTFLQESRELEDDPALQELQQAVVQVLFVSRDGSAPPVARRKGTGFNIHPAGLIVTNKHVVEGADAITVSFGESGSHVVTRWTESEQLDLALLYLESWTEGNNPAVSLPHVELQLQSFPQLGDDMIIMGNPLGFRRIISRGTVSAYRPIHDLPYPILEIEAPIHAGSSGSPVFDSENRAVAVVYATLGGNQGDKIKGLAIPVLYLEELLE